MYGFGKEHFSDLEPTAEKMTPADQAYVESDKSSRRDRRGEIIGRLSGEPIDNAEIKQVELRVINKYFRYFKIGAAPICIDAIHSTPPTDSEIKTILAQELAQSNDANTLNSRIIALEDEYEKRTDSIATTASERVGATCCLPQHSRAFTDLNRDIEAEATIKNTELIEYPYGGQQAIMLLLQESFRKNNLLDTAGKLTKPYLHIAIHGKKDTGEEPDIVIANGMKDSRLACDPTLARWAEHFIRQRLEEHRLIGSAGQPVTVSVAREGQRLNGASVNVNRRWGNDNTVGLGENYQHLQIEFGSYVRKNSYSKLSQIVAELAEEFQKALPTGDFSCGATEDEILEDEQRLNGKIVCFAPTIIYSKIRDVIWLNESFRKSLGTNTCDVVDVNGSKLKVRKPSSAHSQLRKPVVSVACNLASPIVIAKID